MELDIRHKDSGEFREAWLCRNMSCEEAAALLLSDGLPNGTFVMTLGPSPCYATVSVVMDKSVRQVPLSRRLPRGLVAFNPVDGKSEEFLTPKEFIQSHRNIFRYNFASHGVPLMDIGQQWSKEYVFVEAPRSNPTAGGDVRFKDCLFGMVTSTYPDLPGGWNVVCDHVAAMIHPSRALLSLADGCGFGYGSRDAAIRACNMFLNFVSSLQLMVNETDSLAKGLLNGIRFTHEKILEPFSSPSECGTTTLLGGMVVQLEASEPDSFAFVVVSVGDVKAFVWSDGVFKEVTVGNRGNIDDPTDPGGAIGPRKDHGQADYRNLRCYFLPVKENDIVLLMSDGMHDNFDPQTCGNVQPSEISPTYKEGTKWADVKSRDASLLKSMWACDKMAKVVSRASAPGVVTPESICRSLVDHCIKNTSNSRGFFAEHPNKRLPVDYEKYPGKMDHTSVVAYRVGRNVEITPDEMMDVACLLPGLMGKHMNLDHQATPPMSPSVSPRHIEWVMDSVQLEIFREQLAWEKNMRAERIVTAYVAILEYNTLSNDDARRTRADKIMSEHFADGCVLVADERFAPHSRSVQRLYQRLTSSMSLMSQFVAPKGSWTTLFDKVTPQMSSYLVQLHDLYEEQRGNGGFVRTNLSPSNSSKQSQRLRPTMGRFRKKVTSAETLPDVSVPSFDAMLKNSQCWQRVLAIATNLGYESPLRFLGLVREFQREVTDVERRCGLAREIFNHFVSPTAMSPVKMNPSWRKSLMRTFDPKDTLKDVSTDLFSEIEKEVVALLKAELYPQLLADDGFISYCTLLFAVDKLNKKFLHAVADGDDRAALNLLDAGADVNSLDSQGFSSLLSAAWRGNYRLCLELLRRGAYVNQESHDNCNIWHILAAGPQSKDGQVPFEWNADLRALLKKINDVALARPTSLNHFKETALHIAVVSRAPIEMVRFLCEKCGCPTLVDCRNSSGATAFDYASMVGSTPEVLDYLRGVMKRQ